MHPDIEARLDLYDEDLKQLRSEVAGMGSSTQDSPKIRARVQRMLKDQKTTLDHVLAEYRKRKFPPIQNPVKIYFPIVFRLEDIKSVLGRARMSDLESVDPAAFQLLESLQPYNADQEWIACLSTAAGRSHEEVMPHKTNQTHSVHIADVVRISDSASAKFKNVKFGSWSVQEMSVSPEGISGIYDPQMPIKIEKEVKRYLDGTKIEIIELCEITGREVRDIAEKFSEL